MAGGGEPRPGGPMRDHRYGPAAFRKPPRAGRTRLVAALSAGAALLLVVVFAFTAWVAPGFLAGGGSDAAAGEDARETAQRIMTGFAQQDKTTLRHLACDTAHRAVTTAISQAHQTTGARLTGRVTMRDGSATVPGRLTMSGDHVDVETGLERREGTWCWQSLSLPGIELRSPRPTG